MLEQLKEAICRANVELLDSGLVILTWGNVSGVDRAADAVVIKPSGVESNLLRPELMVAVSLKDGRVLEGNLNPSSDTATHLELYRAWPAIGGVVHTHSTYAAAWAQACVDIPVLGTTHADFANGPIPCTRLLTDTEIQGDYTVNIGKVIVSRFRQLDPLQVPAVLVANHGSFTWGPSPAQALENAIILEEVSRIAGLTMQLNPDTKAISDALLARHYFRKHGRKATYGQGASE